MKKSLLTILCTLLSVFSWAQGTTAGDGSAEAYAVLTDNQDIISQDATGITYGKTLTFFYDTNKSSHTDAMGVGPFVEHSDREWNNVVNYITSVVFDESFANYTSLTSTAQWFSGCSYLSSISGINNLKTDNVTDMHDMFVGCNFTTLDLSSFNTSNVTNMGYMFSGCSNMTSIDLSSFNTVKVASMNSMFHGCYALKTIYVGSEWTTSNVTESSEMFYGCSNLVGGAGTTYNANRIDYTYAHIDGGENNPGYFTDKNAPTSYVITVTSYGNGQVSVEGVSEVVEDGKKAEVAVTAGGSLEMFFFPGEGYQLDSLMVNGVNVTADVVPATGQSAASYTLNNISAAHSVITYFGEKASYNEAYAVLVSEDGGNIMYATLYYDGNKASHTEGFAVVGLDEMLQNQAWMMNRSNIKTVNFDESFANCNPTSTAYWFAFCNSLTAINGLQYLNTEYVTNMEYMFHMCRSLTSIDLSHFRAKSLTNMNSMFGGCSLLTSLDLSGFFTFTVTNMNYLFSGCTNLKTIYVNKYDWSTESVTAGDGVFENCTSLVGGAGTTFNDGHIDYTYARIDGGPNSTTPGYFTDKDATSKVATPTFSWNEHTLTVSSATEGATIVYNNLKENPVMVEGEGILLYQTYTYTDPLTIIENAKLLFWAQKDGMANSDSITLNYPYTAWVALTDTLTKAKGIYDLALNNANVPDQMKSELASAISVGDSIYQVRNSSVDEIQSVTNRISVIANEVASLISAEDEPYAVLSENNTILTFYYDKQKQKTARGGIDINTRSWDIENGETPPYGGITKAVFDASFANYRPTSTDYWFQGCRNMTTVEGMENLNTSNVTSMWAMFDWCGSLESIDLSHMVTSNAVYLAYMFNGCSSLRSLDVSGFSTEKATDIGAMFRYCSKLTTVDVSHFNTSKVTSFWGLFAECSSLTSLDVSNFNTGQAENMAYMFYDCNQLQSLNVSNFNTSNVTDMLGMFGGCSSLTSLDLSSFNTQNVTNMAAMFYGCSGLTSLNLSGFNTSNVTDMQNMFSGRDMYSACRSLTSLDLSSFNTEKVTDMHDMFSSCSNLTTLDLTNFTTPKVRDFTNMFIGCEALETIYCENNWDSSSLDDQGTSNNMFYGLTKLKGGAGTTYSDEHTGPEYARVDGGPNSTTPGYFTDIDATASVVAPEFRFEGDNLVMTTETQNASIFYKVAELPSMAEAVVDSVKNSLIVTPDGQQSTYYEHPFELKMAAVVKAIAVADNATGTIVSDTTTMVYDYEAWVNLKAAVSSGTDLYGRAQGNPNVDAQLLEQLQWALNEGDMIYNNRAQMDSFEATHFTQRINELCAQIEAQMTPTEQVATPYFRMESDYNNEVAIKTDTDEAEIYYTQNSRMIQGNDTDFGNGTWNLNWKVSGSNASYQVTSGGYNNSYCLKLTSATASTFGSAQAGYKFVSALTKDTYYTLRFKARSESGRGQLQVFCQNDTIDNTHSTVDTLNIGSELADYEVTFKIQNEITNQVVLNFGAVADTYYIDNVLFGAVVSDTTNQLRTRYEQPINLREGATIKAVATKQGMIESTPAVFDYYYDGWMNLRAVYEMAGAITNDCYGDPNVPLQMVQDVEVRVAERYYRLWDRRGREHVDDTELIETYDELRYILDELYRMKSGFTVDGVSYHAIDSTQVEVIPSLEGYYRGAITVPATVNYNNINFRVTTVTQNAFRSEYLTAIFWYAGFALTATDLQSSQNPNLLLYVTEASMAPTDRDNVVINGFAKNIRLSEGGNFHCPQAFTAEAISYTREFKQQTQIGVSRGWETIALPFTVQTITHEQRGVIAPFGNTASNTHFWLRRLTSNGLQAVPTIEANTAYLISMPNSEEYVAEYNLPGRVTFSAENATVPMTEIVKDESADYVMTPCFTNAAAKQGIYVLNVGEQRSGYPEGSIFESNYRAVLPFQAYVEHKGSNPAPPYFIVGDLGGDTTGIDATLVNSERVNSEAWYTLDGRKLQGKPTQKGVYITNGKKVIIK